MDVLGTRLKDKIPNVLIAIVSQIWHTEADVGPTCPLKGKPPDRLASMPVACADYTGSQSVYDSEGRVQIIYRQLVTFSLPYGQENLPDVRRLKRLIGIVGI